jgi:hypothetical protein
LKGAGGRFIWAGVIFDLDTATVVSIQNNNIPGVTGNVSSVGGGWYRISMTATRNFNDFGLQYASSPSNTFGDFGDLVIAGSGVVDYMLWGMQAVVGTQPLPYQETVTRLALPRLDYRNADGTLSSTPRLLLEPQRTNSIRNSTMVGAVAGTPGTLPTNWVVLGAGGLTRTIVGTGIENGVQYIDLRLNGMATGTSFVISTDSNGAIAASAGQVWSQSTYFKTISVPNPPLAYSIVSYYWNTGVFVNEARTAFTPNTTLSRYTATHTIPAGATTNIVHSYRFDLTIGTTYDFTIRIAAPQMELGAFATTFIPTTTAAVTRIADGFTRNNIFTNGFITAAGGTWVVDLSNNLSYSTSAFSAIGIGNTTALTTNSIMLFQLSSGGERVRITKYIAGTPTTLHTTTTSNAKIAIKWNGTTADVFVNGVKVVSGTAFTPTNMENLNTLNLGMPFQFNQSVLFPTPLTDEECITITTL